MSCGKTLSVPYSAMLAATPVFFSALLTGFVIPHSWPLAALSFLLGFASMSAIHALLVPLVPRNT